MSGTEFSAEDGRAAVEAIISRSPYLSWLGLSVSDLQLGRIAAKARWREEWVANPVIGQTQGGILASLVDFAANFALFGNMGRPVLTIDLRVDYHRVAVKGDLIAEGSLVKLGRQVSVCEGRILDEEGRLIASGRGTFLTAPAEKSK
ncbi:hypothetical protein HDIA_0353 [Hartmannibacter diazotrophicus]|uniref:Medium/long-chain acyl-CoA thioesterase YigI n=1 Tax=Hartmannibacter diazotrophicus TaxID=1482074 RepID=A0A2C9D0Y0_9HYPH|nr:PaaI family thioesterase [Hartmannibacter diazotrophicus]SON53894.1 hypothetical protein HDIA_0353 [Hartmannibacter diazotrophicus]